VRNFYVLGTATFLLGCSAAQSPDELLAAARQKMKDAYQVQFRQKMIWEIPDLDEFDTFRYSLDFRKNPEAIFGYDFFGERDGFESAYIQGVQYNINHQDSTVQMADVVDSTRVQYSMLRTFNPIVLLENDPWQYLGDTTIRGKSLSGFRWIEMDTVIDEKKVYLENYLWINPANLLPQFYSRRLYHDGQRNQLIESDFDDWKLADTAEPFVLDFPQGYLTKVEGSDKTPLLKVGINAPEFELTDRVGKTVKLSDFRGKKVLLDFSIINCGWCKIALEQFAKPEYEFAENIVPLYINPVDSEEKIEKYLSKVEIPFTVLLDAKEVGKSYGANAFPTFYLIDESGKIEEVTQGYTDEGILNWRKKSK
jgi:peroxiredoxin